MNITTAVKAPTNWAFFAPGPVGSVGDPLVQTRLRQSCPDMAPRFEPAFSGRNAPFHGSNITDGGHVSFMSGAGTAHVTDSNWGGRRDFKTAHGWYYQDLRAPDKTVLPIMTALPQYDWHNRIGTLTRARVTGDKFLPLPGGFGPADNSVPRGGATPQIIGVAGAVNSVVTGLTANAQPASVVTNPPATSLPGPPKLTWV